MRWACKLCKLGTEPDRGEVHVYVARRDTDPNRPRGEYHAECYVAVCAMYRMMGPERALAMLDTPSPQYQAYLNGRTQAQKVAAVVELMQESRREKNTVTAYRRVLRALNVLGITPAEGGAALEYLEYHNKNGQPWPWLTEQLQKGKRK